MEIVLIVIVLILVVILLSSVKSLTGSVEELKRQVTRLEKRGVVPGAADNAPVGRPQADSRPEVSVPPVAVAPKYSPTRPQPMEKLVDDGEKSSESESVKKPAAPAPENRVVDPVRVAPETPKSVDNTVRDVRKSALVRFLTEDILTKIGIVTLILGVAFFVKYAIDQNWINEFGRVAIGMITGAAIIGVAHKLRVNYAAFSSILVGGGVSVFYITITLAFREYAIFSQSLAFALLIATTVVSVLLSLYYNRMELAVFSLAGGFAAPFLVSSGTGNHIVLFSYIFLLNTGMLIVAFRKQWRAIGVICFAATYLLLSGWLGVSYEMEYKASVMGFIAAFYVQFYLLAIFDNKLAGRRIALFQVSIVLINNLIAFLSMLYVADTGKGLVTLGFAVANAVTLLISLRQKPRDANMIYLFIALVMSFVSLVVPIQLEGDVITMFWALETVILIWLWCKSGIGVFRIGFVIVSVLVAVSYLIDVCHWLETIQRVPILFNSMTATGAVVLASVVSARFLLRRHESKVAEPTGREQQFRYCLRSALLVAAFLYAFIWSITEVWSQAAARCPELDVYLTATWVFIYLGLVSLYLSRKDRSDRWVVPEYVAVVLYTAIYLPLAVMTREQVFSGVALTGVKALFAVHILASGAVAFLLFKLWRSSLRMADMKNRASVTILLTVLSAVAATIGTDNIVVSLCGETLGVGSVMHAMNRIVHPVLWALMATVIMVCGLKTRDALLRKVSLGFFLLIVAKFYAYDVWRMSQAGRIISFVLLGLILLVVSFLQQKIKILIRDESPVDKN